MGRCTVLHLRRAFRHNLGNGAVDAALLETQLSPTSSYSETLVRRDARADKKKAAEPPMTILPLFHQCAREDSNL